MTNTSTPASDYVEWLSDAMRRYERLAKSLVQHHGEKGRVIEGSLKAALRTVLPQRFKLGTGFVLTATGRSSPQLDIVIYDDFENSPILLEGGVGLFPIECVYAFVEVKSDLDSKGIQQAAKSIRSVRALATDKVYVGYETEETTTGKPEVRGVSLSIPLPPRSFVFALRSSLSRDGCMETIQRETTKHEAHIHGLAVLDRGWFVRQHAYKVPYQFDLHDDRTFARFADNVLRCVQSFPMKPAEMTRYLGLVAK